MRSDRAAASFIDDALNADRAVLVSFWRRPELSTTTGTLTDWLENLSDVVELFCDCPPEVAAQRFRARSRHRRHEDSLRTEDALVGQLTALAALGPLGVGTLVRVDTRKSGDIETVVESIVAIDHGAE